jgi:phosphatidylglycerophosphate synthase
MQTNRLQVSALANAAGALTGVRLLIAISFPFFAHDPQVALTAYLLAIATDLGDGAIARHYDHASHTGAFFDGWVDKILHINAAWAMAINGYMPVWWMWMWFSRELIQWVMVMNVVGDFKNGRVRVQETSTWGRITAVSLFGAFCSTLLGATTIGLALTIVTGVTGGAAGIGYVRRHLEDRDQFD